MKHTVLVVAVETGLAISAVRETYPGMEAVMEELGAIVIVLSQQGECNKNTNTSLIVANNHSQDGLIRVYSPP